MAYLVQSRDLPDQSALRARIKSAHLDYIRLHQSRILYSGGIYDASDKICGGIIILNVPSLEEVERFVAEDPFTREGLKQEFVISRTYTACVAGAFVAGQPQYL